MVLTSEVVCAGRKVSSICEVQVWRNLVAAVNLVDIVGYQGFDKVIHGTVGRVVDTARGDW